MNPYELGKQAVLSSNPEPECPFNPGSDSYKEFSDGFVDSMNTRVADKILMKEELAVGLLDSPPVFTEPLYLDDEEVPF